MTETGWLTATDPARMLPSLVGKLSERRLRLFAAACCRRVWRLFPQAPSRRAVEVCEAYADGLADWDDLTRAWAEARPLGEPSWWKDGSWESYAARYAALAASPHLDVPQLIGLCRGLSEAVKAHHWSWESWFGWHKNPRAQAASLRCIVGNPYQPHPRASQVSPTVRAVAEAVYQHDKAAVAPLHDALLEAGLTELADHFTIEVEGHPKGCLCVDLLTGRV